LAPALFSRFRAREREAKKSAKARRKKSAKAQRKKSTKARRKKSAKKSERKKREFALIPPPTVEIQEGKDHSWASLNLNLTALNINH
jgi:Flp pilus assembly protein TadB